MARKREIEHPGADGDGERHDGGGGGALRDGGREQRDGADEEAIEQMELLGHNFEGYLLLVRELILLEVFYRRRGGELPRIEEYSGRFPALDESWLVKVFVLAPTVPTRTKLVAPDGARSM